MDDKAAISSSDCVKSLKNYRIYSTEYFEVDYCTQYTTYVRTSLQMIVLFLFNFLKTIRNKFDELTFIIVKKINY